MKTLEILHGAEPLLASAEAAGARAADHERAFSRLVDDALRTSADALLVAGRLLAPTLPGPELMSRLTALLERARAARVPVVVTCERDGGPEEGAQGWLRHLAARELLHVLAAGAGALPTVRLRAALEVVGVGRPAGVDVLAARVEAFPAARDGVARVALLGGACAWGPLAALRGRAAWVALGGAPSPAEPAEVAGLGADPGPLARRDLDGDEAAAPQVLHVRLGPRGAEVQRVASGDRALVVVRIDATLASSAHDLEETLRERLRARPRGETAPLVRVELVGEAPFDAAQVDETALVEVARDAVGTAFCRVRNRLPRATAAGDRVDPATSRPALERAVLARLAGPRGEAIARLAADLWTPARAGGEDAAAALREALQRHAHAAGRGEATRADL